MKEHKEHDQGDYGEHHEQEATEQTLTTAQAWVETLRALDHVQVVRIHRAVCLVRLRQVAGVFAVKRITGRTDADVVQ